MNYCNQALLIFFGQRWNFEVIIGWCLKKFEQEEKWVENENAFFIFFREFSLSWKLRCERERNEESSTVQ